MRLNIIKLVCILLIIFPLNIAFSQEAVVPSVKITDHIQPIPNTKVIDVDCDYPFLENNSIELTATFPNILQTNTYAVKQIDYEPLGDFNEGEVVVISGDGGRKDDIYSKIISLPFNFCFYGGSFKSIIISDNGFLSFDVSQANSESPYAPLPPIPHGLPKNSIFGIFHDLLNNGQIKVHTLGTAPNRRFIVNFNNIPQYAYGIPGKETTSQIVLYETSNVIDIYVKSRFENKNSNFTGEEAYRKNAVMGLTNSDASAGIEVPGRNTGNWEAEKEAWRFVPDGSISHTIKWTLNGREISDTRNKSTISVSPTSDVTYKVEVSYDGCTATKVTDAIDVRFSQDFPTANDVTTKAFCIDKGGEAMVDLTSYESDINEDTSLSFTYFEDALLKNPISGSATSYTFYTNKSVYVKVHKSGICYSVGKILLKTNVRPVVPIDQNFIQCDEARDGEEIINLNNLAFKGLSGTQFQFYDSYANAVSDIPVNNPYKLNVNGIPNATKQLFMRVWNKSIQNSNCYSIVPFSITLHEFIELNEVETLICNVLEGQDISLDLTKFEEELIEIPTAGVKFEYFSDYKFNKKIPDPTNASIKMNTVVYVKATADGFCPAQSSIVINADGDCDGQAGGGGDPSGSGGVSPICDHPEKEITLNLKTEYLKYYLIDGLSIENIEVIDFTYANTGKPVVVDPQYEASFTLPINELIRAKYKIISTGIEITQDFHVRASQKAEIIEESFAICDTYAAGIGEELVKLYPKYFDLINSNYQGIATEIKFFDTKDKLEEYISNKNLNNFIEEFTLTNEVPSKTIYVYVDFYDCDYDHVLNFELIDLDLRTLPALICDFDDDKKEIVDLTVYYQDVLDKLSLTELSDLEEPFKYYRTLSEASLSIDNFITNPKDFEVALQQYSVFARLNLKDQCPIFVEIKFEFTTTVEMPKYVSSAAICEKPVGDLGYTKFDLNTVITSIDANSEVSFFRTEKAGTTNDPNLIIGGIYDGSTPIIHDIKKENSPSVVYMRVYDANTGCISVQPINIELVVFPSLQLDSIIWCDYLDDDKELINIEDIQNQLIKNNPEPRPELFLLDPPHMLYNFYETEEDARASINVISNTFLATSTNSIWVSIKPKLGDCPRIFEVFFDLISPPALTQKEVLSYLICNNNTGNSNAEIGEELDFSIYKKDILGPENPLTNDHVFSFFESLSDAEDGTNGKLPDVYVIDTFPKEIFARVTLESTGCFSVKKIIINQYESLEEDILDTEIIACSAGQLSIDIDLEDYPTKMLAPGVKLSDFNISYHTSRANALNNNPIIGDINKYPVTPTSDVWIKFVDQRSKESSCFIIKRLGVVIYASPKVQPIYLMLCDGNDGALDGDFVISNLDDYRSDIIPGEDISTITNQFPFTYYRTYEAAINKKTSDEIGKLDFIFNESELITTNPDNDSFEIFARVDKIDESGCFDVVSIQFQVDKKTLTGKEIPIIISCQSEDTKGIGVFDLSVKNNELSNESNLSFRYYETQSDAIITENEIENYTAWTNTIPYEQTIYVRISAPNKCDVIVPKKLQVYFINAIPHVIEDVCEFDAVGNKTTLDLTSYLRTMLSEVEESIQDDLVISFHTTETDAENNIDEFGVHNILSPAADVKLTEYLPVVGPTTLYLRFTSESTGCFVVKELKMHKLAAPEIETLDEIIVCDEDLNGIFDDFTLNSLDTRLVGVVSNYKISYHSSLKTAWLNSELIDKDMPWVMPSTPITIAVRVENIVNACVNTKEIHFNTNPIVPLKIEEETIQQCDENLVGEIGFNDGKSIFDLTQLEEDFVSATDLSLLPVGEEVFFRYYTSKEEASLEQNALANPDTYTNGTEYGETIYVRISAEAYCDVLAEIHLVVTPSILAVNYDLGDICEFVDKEGVETRLDLTSYLRTMLSEVEESIQDDLVISFHTTETNAENNIDEFGVHNILSPAADVKLTEYLPVVGPTTLYLRFTSESTGCFVVKELKMHKLAAPEIETLDEIIVCDEDLNGIFDDFTLNSLDTRLVGVVSNYKISYHSSLKTAWLNSELIDKDMPWVMPSTPITIAVRVENIVNACVNTKEIHFNTNPIVPLKIEEETIQQCDENLVGEIGFNDGKSIFDLTQLEEDFVSATDLSLLPVGEEVFFRYYTSKEEASLEQNALANPDTYTNGTEYGETIYVRISAEAYCDVLAEIHLVVTPSILAVNYDLGDICEFVDKEGVETRLDLTSYLRTMLSEVEESIQDDLVISFHTTETDAENNIDEFGVHNILSPAADVKLTEYLPVVGSTTLYLRFTSESTGCFVVKELKMHKLAAPEIETLDEIIVCDEDLNGIFDDFTLNSLDTRLVEVVSKYKISYHSSLKTAWLNSELIDKDMPWVMPSTPITIAVRVENIVNACVNTKEIHFNTNPIVPLKIEEETIQQCDENLVGEIGFNDGKSIFDLTQLEEDFVSATDLSLLPVGEEVFFRYYTSKEEASLEQNALANPDTYTNGTEYGETIYVRISAEAYCDVLAEIHLVVTPSILAENTDFGKYCEYVDETDAKTTVDLTSNLSEMLAQVESNVKANLLVSFHFSNEDADANINSIGNYDLSNPINISALKQFIPEVGKSVLYVRFTDTEKTCYAIREIAIEIEDSHIESFSTSLAYCDPNNDGEGSFHLSDARPNITSDPDATLAFYRTLADANNQVNPLPEEVNNNILGQGPKQRVYVRVSNEKTICFSIVELHLEINNTPKLVVPEQVILCDVDASGSGVFDLEGLAREEVMIHLEDLNNYTIAFYENEQDLENQIPIHNPSVYTSKGGVVFLTVEDLRTGCSTKAELKLFVAPMPEVYPPTPMELCDVINTGDERERFYLEDAIDEITRGDTSLKVTFHRTQNHANSNINSLQSPYKNIENNQTIYIRVENEYACVITTGITLTLVVNPLPAPVTPPVYETCDIDNEGFAYFDLEPLKLDIIANEPNVDLSFHETYKDAVDGMWEVDTHYQNIIQGEQVLYARVFFENSPNATSCFKIVEVVLKANATPLVPIDLDALYYCTPDTSTPMRVNLGIYKNNIYGNQDRSKLSLTYHISREEAEKGTNFILEPENFLLKPPTPVTIYARLANELGCYNIVSFDLHLVTGPQIVDPSPLRLCSALGKPNNNLAVFDLLDKRAEIVDGVRGLEVYYYINEEDALSGQDNYITNPESYTNISNPQQIYVRVEDSQANEAGDTGCVAFTTLLLHVDPNPEAIDPDPIRACHLDTSVDYTFVDLTIREKQILNHENWDLAYFETFAKAVEGDLHYAIGLPEAYKVTYELEVKTIYVRVSNPISGCFDIVELVVILSELPEMLPAEELNPIIACFSGTRLSFDLTQKIPEIFGSQNLEGLKVYFFEDLVDAIDGQNPIQNPEVYYNTDYPQTIYVGIGNLNIEGCYIGGVTWFDIEVKDGAIAHNPINSYKMCGKPGEGYAKATFYLEDSNLRASILGAQDPNFFDLRFYLTEAQAHEGAVSDVIDVYYENIANPQVIYARVINKESGCYAIAEVTLDVVELDGLILEDLYSLCLDEFGNPLEDANGNILYPTIHTGLDANENIFSWFYEGTRLLGQKNPYLEAKDLGSYRVEILNLKTGCTIDSNIEVVESAAPHIYGAKVTTPAFSGNYDIVAWAEGNGDYVFSLDFGAFQEKGFWANVGVGKHVVTIKDANGCGSVEMILSVIDYPKFFTPNDDGYNDTWNIPGMSSLDPSAEIFIFDRHGKLLGQISPSGEGWDGSFNGRPMPSSDYWFVVKYLDQGEYREFKAHFSLKR